MYTSIIHTVKSERQSSNKKKRREMEGRVRSGGKGEGCSLAKRRQDRGKKEDLRLETRDERCLQRNSNGSLVKRRYPHRQG
jgi:hypothetical protein